MMSRLESDLVDLIQAALDKQLDQVSAKWKDEVAVGVVLAAHNYPDEPRKGDVITGIDEANQIGKVFHAGTSMNQNHEWVTNGGRVLCVVGLGQNTMTAKANAYEALSKIQFDGMQYRTDIADKEIQR